MLEWGRAPGGGAAAAGGDGDGGTAALPPKPFLRRGAGWAARIEAAREGRRYVPRGGPVKDYSQEGEAPLPRRARPRGTAPPSRIPRSPAKQPGTAKPAPAGSGYGARRAVAVAPPQQPNPQGRPQRSHPASPAHVGAVAGAPSGDHWARKLMGQAPAAPPPVQRPGWEAQEEEQELGSLEEFQALETQVLREVGNSPRAAGSGRKKGAAGGSGVPSPFSPARAAGGPAGGGWPAARPAEQLQQEFVEEEADVFQSDGEGSVHGLAGSRLPHGQQGCTQAAAAGVVSPLARRAVDFDVAALAAARPAPVGARAARQQPIYHDDPDEEEGEMQAQSAFMPGDTQPLQPSGLVQAFFRPAPPPAAAGQVHGQAPPLSHPHARLPAPPAASQRAFATDEADAVEQLQQEVVRLQEERARVARLRMELEEAAARLEHEKEAFEKRKLEDAAKFEAERGEELRKLQRDRRVLEKQSRAILKMPTKQSKEEVAAVEALLAEERKIGRAREARHKLATERLRQQVLELQGRNAEMKEQIRYLEQQRLELQPWAGGSGGAQAGDGAAPPSASPPATARATPSKQRLPAVRVERGGGGSGSRRVPGSAAPSVVARTQQPGGLAPARPAAHGWAQAARAAAEEDEAEPLIADVHLEEEEVVTVCEEASAEDATGACSGAAGAADERWHADGAATALAPQQVPQQPAAAAVAGVMEQASSALARFQQLHASLVQHEGLQGRIASRLASLGPSPQAHSSLGVPAGDGGAAAQGLAGGAALPAGLAATDPASACSAPTQALLGRGGEDDLRRLGRTLLAASASGRGSPTDLGLPPVPAAAEQQQAAGPAPGSSGDSVVSESQQHDGRWERLWASGLREQRFTNGSTKQSLPGGATLTCFANGDIKKALPGGDVEYYYAEVDSWQVTHPSGVDVFFFPSGQVEAHHPGGVREILFADGAVRKVLPDGRELAISAAHLSREIQQAPPVASLLPGGGSGGA